MEDILPILQELDSISENSVLATIIHVEGSSYKREGSCMLIQENGRQIGMLSAGCLEEDLHYRAMEILEEGEAKVIFYDMKDETDLSWGQGAGCNGTLRILLEPVDEKLKNDLFALKHYLDLGEAVLHTKHFSDDIKLIDYGFLTRSRIRFGSTQRNLFAHSLNNPFEQTSGIQCIDTRSTVYTHLYKPKPKLFIFGGGPDAKPVVDFAAAAGFSVTLCDWRPALCNKVNFPNVDRIILGFPWEIFKQISLTSKDFIVIMTHHFQKDKEIYSFLSNYKFRYLGILGPQARTKRLIKNNDIPSSISSPVGIPIGAQGPEEIAISIVAELIQVLRKPVTVKT